MSKKRLFIVIAIAAVIAAFFLVVPIAKEFAAKVLGWDQSGQAAFAKFTFFPILLAFLGFVRWLGNRNRSTTPD